MCFVAWEVLCSTVLLRIHLNKPHNHLVCARCRFGVEQPASDAAADNLPSSKDGKCVP